MGKFLCKLFGHKWQRIEYDFFTVWECQRCGVFDEWNTRTPEQS